MSYLKTFSPWIAYWVGTAVADWRVGLAAGLVVGIAVLVADATASDRPAGLDLISLAGVVYFAALLPYALLQPTSTVSDYTAAMALAVLGLAAAGSILAGHPFTETFAKQEVPEAFWSTPQFRNANRVITTAWAVSFFANAAILAGLAAVAPDQIALRIVVQVVGFVAPLKFTAWYRARIRSGLPTQSAAATSAATGDAPTLAR